MHRFRWILCALLVVALCDVSARAPRRPQRPDGSTPVKFAPRPFTGGGANQAPVVDAGADTACVLPAPIVLAGAATDDGVPAQPGLSSTWSLVSGPGTVTIDDDAALATRAWFDQPGSYVLRLTAHDGLRGATDELVVEVAATPRVTAGLVALYPLFEGEGTTVPDRSGVAPPLDLELSGQAAWSAGGNGVSFTDGRVGSTGPATKVIDALVAGDASSFEVWVETADLVQDGPRRIVTIGGDADYQNFVLGQQGDDIQVRLLHTGKNAQAHPRLTTTDGFLTGSTTHLVHTYDGAVERLWVNGVEHPTTVSSVGSYDGWDPTDPINFGIEGSLERPWHGTLRWAAIYERALSQAEILQNFAAGPAGDGDAPVNQPPSVDAGPPQAVQLPSPATVTGVVSDDGLPVPPGALTLGWSLVSGPAAVSFADAASAQTDVTFSVAGSYTLRLTADDGALQTSDDVAVVVSVAAPAPFTDITAAANAGGPSWFGGHGVQLADVDGDGRPDFYVTMNFDQPMAELFYRNLGGNVFAEEAALRGIDDFDSGTHGGVWADLDADGDYDLYNGAYTRNRIYENDGSGFFTDVTVAAGLPTRNWPTRGVAAFDMEGDGDLDLFAVTGWMGSMDPASERNEIYRNDGGMSFTSIDVGDLFTAPVGQGVTDSDFDGDGDVDLIAANIYGDLNILRNDGAGVFTLVPPGPLGITHRAHNGITLADLDNDGDLELLLQQYLYDNDGDGTYTFVREFTEAPTMGGFEDLDNDGDWDLVFPGVDHVQLNDGTGSFVPSPAFALGPVDDPRCVAFADIDGDGDRDFVYAQKRTFNRLIRNDYDGPNRWLDVRLTRADGQAGAFGAIVAVFQPGQLGQPAGRIAWREARSQEGYLGQNDPVLHFGVGLATTVDVRVVFPGGITVDLAGVATAQTIDVVEP